VCGILFGVTCIGLSGCWGVVLCSGSFVLGCIVVGVKYCVGVTFNSLCGCWCVVLCWGHLYGVVFLLECGIVLCG